jgi:hypothetical protein
MGAASLIASGSGAQRRGSDLHEGHPDLARAAHAGVRGALDLAHVPLRSTAGRPRDRSYLGRRCSSNMSLWGAIAIGVALQAFAILRARRSAGVQDQSRSGRDIGLVLAFSAVPLVIGERHQAGRDRRRRSPRALV